MNIIEMCQNKYVGHIKILVKYNEACGWKLTLLQGTVLTSEYKGTPTDALLFAEMLKN